MTTQETIITIRSVRADEDWAVRHLFGQLHQFNASLDGRFALADGWERILDEHLCHVRAAGHGLTMLAWEETTPVGLLMMDGHTDSPLFRHRHWAELLALYVAPEVRGTRLAQRLVTIGTTWAHGRGYERVQLYVTASNAHAKRFYASVGFSPAQEVWRAELGPSAVLPPNDPDCEAIYAHGHDLLAPHTHHLGGDSGLCETR